MTEDSDWLTPLGANPVKGVDAFDVQGTASGSHGVVRYRRIPALKGRELSLKGPRNPRREDRWPRGAVFALLLTAAGVATSAHEGTPSPGACVEVVRARLAAAFVTPRQGVLLTRLEGDTLEDASLYGGFYLAALVAAWDQSRDEATGSLARRLLTGLLRNASAAGPGFIARGVEERGAGFRGDPSVDQYTGLLYGLFQFHRSGLATPADRRRISGVFARVLHRLKRDGYRIMTAGGSRETRFGDLAAVMPTRSERLLAFLVAGWEVTGDEEWRSEYEKACAVRLSSLHGFSRFDSWVLVQTAAGLDMLCTLERQPDRLETYRAAAREAVERCRQQVAPYHEFLADDRPAARKLADTRFVLRTVRIPVEAAVVVLLCGDDSAARRVAPAVAEMLSGWPVAGFRYSPPLVALEWAYWLAVRRGLLGSG